MTSSPRRTHETLSIQPAHVPRLGSNVTQRIATESGATLVWASSHEIKISGRVWAVENARQRLLDEIFRRVTRSNHCPSWVFEWISWQEASYHFPEIEISNVNDRINIVGHPSEVNQVYKKLMAEIACYEEVRISVPKEYHKCIIGKNGHKHAELERKYQVSLLMPLGDSLDTVIVIRGRKQEVGAAKSEINALVAGLVRRDKKATLLVRIQPSYRHRIENAIFEKIKNEGGVDAKWLHDGNILLSGARERLKPVEDVLLDALHSTETKRLKVPSWLMPYLTPSKNEGEKKWTQVTVTTIASGLSLTGHSTEVTPLFSYLTQALEHLRETKCRENLQVSREFHGRIIGKKGQKIKSFKSKHQVEIHIPKEEENSDNIILEGDKDKVEAAKKEILEFVRNLETSATKTIQVESIMKKYVPDCISEMLQQFPQMKIEATERKITFVGKRDRVDQASVYLQEKLSVLKNKIKTVTIPTSDRSLFGIIGWKQRNMRKLRSDYKDLSIHYSMKPARVIIEGERDDVEKAHIDIAKTLLDLADYCVAEVKIQYMGRFIGTGGSNLANLKQEHQRVQIETPQKERRDDPVLIIGNERYVDDLFNSLYRYGAEVVRIHTKLPDKGGVGSTSPIKGRMYGSRSSLGSCVSCDYDDANESDDSTGYNHDEEPPLFETVFHEFTLRNGWGKFLSGSEKHRNDLRAILTDISFNILGDKISVAGQVQAGQKSAWTWKIHRALEDFLGQFAYFETSFPQSSSVQRQNYHDDDLSIRWNEYGDTVTVWGIKSKVDEKQEEYEEIKQRKRKLSYSWKCEVALFLKFLRESLSEHQRLEEALKNLGRISMDDGKITISGDVLEAVTKENWISECEKRLSACFSDFATEEISIPFLLTGAMREYCDSRPEVIVAWAENSSIVVFGKKTEVLQKAGFLKKKLDQLKSRKNKVSHSWNCEDRDIFDFVRESVEQMEKFVKFLGEIGSPDLADGVVTVRSEVLQTQSVPEWEEKCHTKVEEFFNQFRTQIIDVNEAQVKHAKVEVETRSSVVTKWIQEKNCLRICGVKYDVNLKVDSIKKRMEKAVIQSQSINQLHEFELGTNLVVDPSGGFTLDIQLAGTKMKCVLASKKESELCNVRIRKGVNGLKISGERHNIALAKTFIDSLVVDEFEVKKYGAFQFLSESTIGLQIEHIGIKHNCTILEEKVMDSVYGERKFICLPAEIDMATIFGSLSVTVKEGDITSDDADMIVNTSDRSFSFRGPLSRSIFSKGGESLKAEFFAFGRIDNEMGLTPGGSLKCKKILHVAIPTIHDSMEALVSKILREANNRYMKSITLPAIGAGGGGWKPCDVAVGMRNGIASFMKMNPNPAHLKKVKVMLYPSDSLDKKPFYDQLMKSAETQDRQSDINKESQPSLFQRVFSLFRRQPQATAEVEASDANCSEKSHKSANPEAEKPVETKKMKYGEFAKIIISSNNENSVKEAKKEVRKFIDRNLKECVFDKEDVTKLKQAHFERMRKLAEEQKVRIIVNRENGNHFITVQGVDECFSHAKDEIEKIMSTLTSDLPETWCEMPDGQKVTRVSLEPNTKEYLKVERKFNQANIRRYHNFSVSRIERIQNPTLYQQYQSKKKEIEVRGSTSGKIDRKLFHGTDAGTVTKICNDVFNRSYAGKNATAYGKGVYFSTQSSYSDSFTSSSFGGLRQMFLARVLTGDYCQGESSMRDPPMNTRTGELYDSLVDSMSSPSIFVVFRDWSVYPLYVITYHHK